MNANHDPDTRIKRRFEELRRRGEKGFIAYITAGDPSLSATMDVVLRLEDAGADVVELGVPFSDPLADGKVNQDSAARALAGGARLGEILDRIGRLRERCEAPILLYCYLNLLLARGLESNLRRAASAGVDGFLVLDLPVEESGECARILRARKMDHVCLVTPTSPEDRIRKIVKTATGFVYCVSREGVTGMQKRLAPAAVALVERTHALTDLPVALGFGISTPDQAREAARAADAVVVGSAIVDRYHRSPHTPAGRAKATAWVGKLVRAVKEVRA